MCLSLCMRSGLAVSLGLYVIFQFRVLERQVRVPALLWCVQLATDQT